MTRASRYGVVAYVKDPVGEFIRNLRQELHLNLPHLAAHLSLLPPRCLNETESTARELIEKICSGVEPFEVTLGEVETFIPVTPTVFIRVAHGASRMREVHSLLNTDALGGKEEWPYLPHLTIVKMGSEEQAQEAYRIARHRWSQFEGARSIQIEGVIFVREEAPNRWIDLAKIPLGPAPIKR